MASPAGNQWYHRRYNLSSSFLVSLSSIALSNSAGIEKLLLVRGKEEEWHLRSSSATVLH